MSVSVAEQSGSTYSVYVALHHRYQHATAQCTRIHCNWVSLCCSNKMSSTSIAVVRSPSTYDKLSKA